ncbi:hypothetical protein [Nitrospirillum iridis]|uniref:Uncharacterized protein n=1 Tax=Nitrospirillum iridis TaxID=765888 RepID=A0A7X0ECS3_9PROT|nr:hypothetical protein [Nitrospirillum iridis]MBB6251400.1 hypothetical protein [Nitrospirillum iridis]
MTSTSISLTTSATIYPDTDDIAHAVVEDGDFAVACLINSLTREGNDIGLDFKAIAADLDEDAKAAIRALAAIIQEGDAP